MNPEKLLEMLRNTPGGHLIHMKGAEHGRKPIWIDGERYLILEDKTQAETDVLLLEEESRRDAAEAGASRELARMGAHHHGF